MIDPIYNSDPKDYNEAEKLLLPNDATAIVMSNARYYSHVCGDTCVNNLLYCLSYKSMAHTIIVVGYTI